MKEASIIITSYKQHEFCLKAVDSVKNNTNNVDYELIVVDDSHEPSSKLGQWLIDLKDRKEIKLATLMGINHGHRFATEMGISLAKGEFLVFVNDDVEIPDVSKQWLRQLIDYLKENERVASVTPASYHKDRTVYWVGITKYPGGHDFIRKPMDHPLLPKRPVECIYNNMACFVTKKWYFDNGYGFNMLPDNVNHYGDDSGWSFQIMTKLKHVHMCLPHVWVFHHNIHYLRK